MTVVATHPYIEALLKGYEAPRGGISWLNARRAHALRYAASFFDDMPSARHQRPAAT